MASYAELAPELSQAVTQEQAEAFAQNVISGGTPTPPRTIADLSPQLLAAFLKWVQWYGRYGADSFKAHAHIVSATYDGNSLTIVGTEFVSVAGGAMGVRMTRPGVTTINRTRAQIEGGGGTYETTQIVVRAASIPSPLQTGDLIVVVADGLDSNALVLGG